LALKIARPGPGTGVDLVIFCLGVCNGGYVQISQTHIGCATARNKGTCYNRLGISREALEQTILEGLKQHLMDPELFKEFCAEFIKEVNRLRRGQAGLRAALDSEMARIGRRIRKIVDAIADGVPARSIKDELLGLEAREDEVKVILAATPEPKVYLAPNMAEIYRQRAERSTSGHTRPHRQDRPHPCRGQATDRPAWRGRRNPAILFCRQQGSISARTERRAISDGCRGPQQLSQYFPRIRFPA
jgi:hypothetical protein